MGRWHERFWRPVRLLVLAVVLAGCVSLTQEQLAALEAQQRQYAVECQQRGGYS